MALWSRALIFKDMVSRHCGFSLDQSTTEKFTLFATCRRSGVFLQNFWLLPIFAYESAWCMWNFLERTKKAVLKEREQKHEYMPLHYKLHELYHSMWNITAWLIQAYFTYHEVRQMCSNKLREENIYMYLHILWTKRHDMF